MKFTTDELDEQVRTICEDSGIQTEAEHFDILTEFARRNGLLHEKPRNLKSYKDSLADYQ